MPAKKVALFVDVDCLHQHLRHLHNRGLDPALLLETAGAQGELIRAEAIADWSDLPEELKEGCAARGLAPVEVGRALRSRETGGKRREVLRGMVDLEILARVVELLFTDGAPEVDTFVLATADDAAARIAGVVRDRFQKRVVGLGVEAVTCPAFQEAVDAYEVLPMPAIEPQDPESLSRLVPLLEELERRKRYLNFKYIRETVVRRLELPERSFDAAEQILSDAIACGVLLKQKIMDKYNPGQLFTAYSLNRESPYFHQWGSGEPAPDHDELEEEEPKRAMPALPSLGGRGAAAESKTRARPGRDKAPEEERDRERKPRGDDDRKPRGDDDRKPRGDDDRKPRDDDRKPRDDDRKPRDDDRKPRDDDARDDDADDDARGRRRASNRGGEPEEKGGGKRRRRRRGRGGNAAPGVAEEKIKLSAGGGKRRGGGPRNHQQDRVGRAYEAPSRFLADESERPQLSDDDIDEDRILRARGD